VYSELLFPKIEHLDLEKDQIAAAKNLYFNINFSQFFSDVKHAFVLKSGKLLILKNNYACKVLPGKRAWSAEFAVRF
jgi:hypothetical protein